MNSKRINNETSTVNEVTGLKENTRIADYSVFATKFARFATANFCSTKSRIFTSLYL